MDTGLEGKTVLITGGAKGIGLATAEAFAREGASLALVDVDGTALEEAAARVREAGASVATSRADLSTARGISEGLESTLEAFGGDVDVLVNNVGAGAIHAFDELTDEVWDATMQLNFYSYVRATRYVLPKMRARGGGVVVNNASDLARQPEVIPIDYSVSKAAVLALTKALARAEGPSIRINAVAPGPIWTPFWTKPGGFAEMLGNLYDMPPRDAVEHEMRQRQLPLERLGRPEEVAAVIVFLASDLASYVTSSVWGVDGGSIRNLF